MYRKVLKKYKERKILQQIFIGTFGISVICILIACSIGFSWFQTNTEKELVENQKSELSNYFLVIDNYMTSAQDTLEILSKNMYVKRIIAMGDMSWDDNMSIVANTVVNTLSVNPRLHSIYVIGASDILMKSTNSKFPMTGKQDEEMREYFKGSYLKRYHMISYQDVFGKEQLILSITTGDLKENELSYSQGVMVNLDLGGILKEVFPVPELGENYVIMDYNYNVLGAKGERYQVGDYGLEDAFLREVITDGSRQNMLELKDANQSYYLNYISSPGEYYIVQITPKDKLMVAIQQTKWIVILVGVLLAFIALTISFFVAMRVYHPIDEVVNILSGKLVSTQKKTGKKKKEIKQKTGQSFEENLQEKVYLENKRHETSNELSMISHTMSMMVQQLNQFHEEKEKDELGHYLTSKSQQVGLPEHLEELYEGKLTQHGFHVIVLRICDVDDFLQNNTEEAIQFQMQSIANLANQELSHKGETDVLMIDHEYIAMILFEGIEQQSIVEVKENLQKLLYLVNEMLSLKLDAGISVKHYELVELREGYQGARAATSYRFLYGMNAVIQEEQMQQCALSGEVCYDLKKLMDMVKRGNQEGFLVEYQTMLGTLKGYSIQSSYELLISLAVEMLKYQKEISQFMAGMKFSDLEQIRQEIMSFTYIGDTTTWFLDLFASILSSISKVQNSGSADIVSGAVHFIEENYMDYNLSAQFLAGKYNITPSYFSRIFNEALGCAFPDYLSSLRLEKAKKLMIEKPNKSIQSICEAVGYTSSSYFTALFKKKYGVTPSKYRISQLEV